LTYSSCSAQETTFVFLVSGYLNRDCMMDVFT